VEGVPGSIYREYRGGFVMIVNDGGELLAKVYSLLGSVAILVYVVVSGVVWVQSLNGSSDQGDGIVKVLVRVLTPGLQYVKVPRQGVRSADMPGSWCM
jgi:hypothetical protein